MIDQNFMKEAITEAKLAQTNGDLPFGAVIVFEDKVVGRGHARNNTSDDVTAHAEIEALREACKTLKTTDLSKCRIYCTAEPCNMCGSAIFQADIKELVIGVSRNDLPWLMRPRSIQIENLAEDTSFDVEIRRSILKDEIFKLFEDAKSILDIHKNGYK